MAHHLESLLGYLKQDPGNANLVQDLVTRAVSAGETALADEAVALFQESGATPAQLTNLRGVRALQERDHKQAIPIFREMLDHTPNDIGVRFNLAWAHALAGDMSSADEALDEATSAQLPQAAMLKMQIIHDKGDFEQAEAFLNSHLARHCEHQGFAAAAATLALDLEDLDLAERCAEAAGDLPDGLAARGTLALRRYDTKTASQLFGRAIAASPRSARAWLGKGLISLTNNDPQSGADELDQAATIFETHIGSWVAAGWAHLIAGSLDEAERRFRTAYELDPNFAECRGSLAVVAILNGEIDQARELARTARAIDANCFSAALAHTLLLSGDGEPEMARQVFERALTTPVDKDGTTVAAALVQLAV